MKEINHDVRIGDCLPYPIMLDHVERAGRTCYQSFDKIKEGSAESFIRGIINNGHESVLEHASITVRITTDRGVTHEIVRHRLASYSQESTRYCNYGKKEIEFVKPVQIKHGTEEYKLWRSACEDSEMFYNELIRRGTTPQNARSVLNNSLKTELVMTANIREWRHFFKLRTSVAAHPDIRAVARIILMMFIARFGVFFEDLEWLLHDVSLKGQEEKLNEQVTPR